MHELHRVPDRVEIRQRINDPVKRREATEGEEQRDHHRRAPEPDVFPLARIEDALALAERLRELPQREQHHQHAGVFAGTVVAREALVMFLPAGLLADTAPVIATIRRIEPIAE